MGHITMRIHFQDRTYHFIKGKWKTFAAAKWVIVKNTYILAQLNEIKQKREAIYVR